MSPARAARDRRSVAKRAATVAWRSAGDALPRRGAMAAAAGIVILGLVHMIVLWFVCDDAFISYRYAANLAHGLGPVYNAGERVEGYSNFLWMLLGTAVIRLGAEPETWMPVVSAVAALGTLVIVVRALHARGMNLVPAGIVLAASPCFAAWATGGLETAMFGLALTAGTLALVRATAAPANRTREADPVSGPDAPHALWPSLASGLWFGIATLTRPEALFLSPIAAGDLLLAALRGRVPRRAVWAWVGAWAACVAPLLAWRVSYYHRLLPNSFYVKSPGLPNVMDGLGYLMHSFLDLYLGLPLAAAFALLASAARARARPAGLGPIAVAIAVYGAYVATTGGDFMPLYRFVAPIVPLIAVAAGILIVSAHAAIAERWSRGTARAVTAVLLVAYACLGVERTRREQDAWTQGDLASVGLMRNQTRDWGELGRKLRQVSLPTDSLATTAAGIIPYESRLYTIDLLGLNAADLSRFRRRSQGMAGHRWLMSEESLSRLAPQFLLGHPMVRSADAGVELSLDLKPEWRARFDSTYRLVAVSLSGWPPRRVGCLVRRDVADRVMAAGERLRPDRNP